MTTAGFFQKFKVKGYRRLILADRLPHFFHKFPPLELLSHC
jgi:hypothetical protein